MKKESIIKGIIVGTLVGMYTVVMSYMNLKYLIPELDIKVDGLGIETEGAVGIVISYIIVVVISILVVEYLFSLKSKKKK